MKPPNAAAAAMALCLDEAAMAGPLQAVLPECVQQGWQVAAVGTSKVRRSASLRRNPAPLSLCYQVLLQHPLHEATLQRAYYAKLYRDADQLARDRAAGPVLQLPESPVLQGHGVLLWPWPHDPVLRQLPALLDPRAADVWWPHRAIEVQLLRHEPEDRASLCYASAGAPGHRLFAKTFADDRGRLVHRRFQHFWQAAQDDPDAPSVAQPLGWCDRTRTLWQAEAPGVPLARVLPALDASAVRELPAALAGALAAVHAAPRALAGPQPHDTAHWLREVQRRCSKIARVAPELAPRTSLLAQQLQELASRLAPSAPAVVHGDFHVDQVWLDGARVVLFDFDEFVPGDPMEDLAAFVTRLGDTGRAASLGPLLLAAYAQCAPARFEMGRLRWHLAVQSLLQAGRAFRFQRPHWRDEVQLHLQRAEALCGLAEAPALEAAA